MNEEFEDKDLIEEPIAEEQSETIMVKRHDSSRVGHVTLRSSPRTSRK